MKILCQLKWLNEIYSAYTTFPIQNGLKQGDAVRHFSTLLTMPLGTPKKTRRKRNLIDKNISCLVFAEDANFLGENMNSITKNTDTLLVSNREVRRKVNAVKNIMSVSCERNAGQNNHTNK
jgi:hypothetical protein